MELNFDDEDAERFIGAVRPFLLVVAHTEFLDCLAVDAEVAYLYRFINGTEGSRAIPFFQRICKAMLERQSKKTELDWTVHLLQILTALSTLL
jgi:hypothetical protein